MPQLLRDALAGRLFDRLARRFRQGAGVPGHRRDRPRHEVRRGDRHLIGGCDALIALIGKGWLEAKDAEGRRRLDLPRDFVKAEIAAALEQDKLVIPALIDDTPMPPCGALPADSRNLPIGTRSRSATRASTSMPGG